MKLVSHKMLKRKAQTPMNAYSLVSTTCSPCYKRPSFDLTHNVYTTKAEMLAKAKSQMADAFNNWAEAEICVENQDGAPDLEADLKKIQAFDWALYDEWIFDEYYMDNSAFDLQCRGTETINRDNEDFANLLAQLKEEAMTQHRTDVAEWHTKVKTNSE